MLTEVETLEHFLQQSDGLREVEEVGSMWGGALG